MTPFEVTSLTDESLNAEIQKIIVPDYCGESLHTLFSDYDFSTWKCLKCDMMLSEERYFDKHAEFDWADYILFMLEEMGATLTQFHEKDSGWLVCLPSERTSTGATYTLKYKFPKDLLTSGAGKSILRAIGEAYLVFKSTEEKGSE